MSKHIPKPSDETLWKHFLAGDELAFKQLYDRFYNPLYSYAHSFHINNDFISECIQDLFVKLWQNKKNLSLTPSPKHYLLRALRNLIYNKQALHKHEVYMGSMEDLDLLNSYYHAELPFTSYTPLSTKIEQHIQKLTSRQQEAIYLYYVEGFNYKEIGEFLQIRTEGAYKLIYRAIAALKENLKV